VGDRPPRDGDALTPRLGDEWIGEVGARTGERWRDPVV